MNGELPDWVLDLVAAIDLWEHDHPDGAAACFAGVMEAVPSAVLAQARRRVSSEVRDLLTGGDA